LQFEGTSRSTIYFEDMKTFTPLQFALFVAMAVVALAALMAAGMAFGFALAGALVLAVLLLIAWMIAGFLLRAARPRSAPLDTKRRSVFASKASRP
jgi:predicted lysophospholipase L1 biosynthesis ABC-type transport system permease subunit